MTKYILCTDCQRVYCEDIPECPYCAGLISLCEICDGEDHKTEDCPYEWLIDKNLIHCNNS